MVVVAPRQLVGHPAQVRGIHGVVLGAHHQCGHLDTREIGSSVPVQQLAAGAELARTSIPSCGRKPSKGIRYSCVAAGPPCSSSIFSRGLLPARLVHTRKSPLGVLTGIIRSPPEMRSARPVLSRYPARSITVPPR